MTVVVTNNAAGRVRGFLASCMCEIAPGVYTSPRMNPAVRERVWEVLEKWFDPTGQASMVMTWSDSHLPGGQEVRTLGLPKKELFNLDGIYLVRSDA